MSSGLFLFLIAGERHAVPADAVLEVTRAVAPAPLPGAPSSIVGVVDRRGTVVPVLDCRRRFGHESRPVRLSDNLVFVSAGPRELALLVDQAVELAPLPEGALVHAASFVTHAGTLAGVARIDGLVFVHDLAAFLAQAEGERLDAALDAREDAA